MVLDPGGSRIGQAKRIAAKEVFNLNKINQMLQQWCFQKQLCFFENIVFVAWEKLFGAQGFIVSQN